MRVVTSTQTRLDRASGPVPLDRVPMTTARPKRSWTSSPISRAGSRAAPPACGCRTSPSPTARSRLRGRSRRSRRFPRRGRASYGGAPRCAGSVARLRRLPRQPVLGRDRRVVRIHRAKDASAVPQRPARDRVEIRRHPLSARGAGLHALVDAPTGSKTSVKDAGGAIAFARSKLPMQPAASRRRGSRTTPR